MYTRLAAPIISILITAFCSRFSAADALLFTSPPRRALLQRLNSNTATLTKGDSTTIVRRRATKEDTETWSKATKGESRLGVRKRVRAVLAKARQRTGVSNDSEGATSGSSMLTSDSSLGLEATYNSRPTWSISNVDNSMADDLLGADASLSLAGSGAGEYESEFLYSYQPVNPDEIIRNNGKSLNGSSEPHKKNGATVPSLDSIRAGAMNRSDLSAETRQLEKKTESALTKPQFEPLPFVLPQLTPQQRQLLESGERVQEQSKMGGEGSGFVVFDVPAPAYAIWEVLLDFERYPDNIGTVRSMRMFTNTHLKQSFYSEKPLEPGERGVRHYGKACISRASFILSKFRLNIAAVHRYQPHQDGHYMVFTLDKACTNAVLQDAKGIWYTEANPEGKEGSTRVWLLCELKVSNLLPKFIVDYAAKRAMPRATTWLPGCVADFMKNTKKR